jgi:DNA mismatch repair protein MutS
VSIAWAIAEHLHDEVGARTLFATHYHELTELAATRDRVVNLHIAVKEWQQDIVFLRRLEPGGTNRSYGIQVARLAGLPEQVVARARQVLSNLESQALAPDSRPRLARGTRPREGAAEASWQLSLFAPALPPGAQQVLDRLARLRPEEMTPRQALDALFELSELLGG